MAGSFLFGMAESLTEKIASRACEEASKVAGAYEDLREFKLTLSYVKAVLLDAEQKQEHNHELKEWLRQIKRVLSDAENVLDEVDCETLQHNAVWIEKQEGVILEICCKKALKYRILFIKHLKSF